MRFTFLAWLSGLICAAFAVAVGYSHVRFITDAENRATQTISARLGDLMELLVHSDAYVGLMRDMTDAAAMERTRALAEIIRLNPAMIKDDEALQGICNDLGVRQALVTDGEGKIVAAVPESLVGTDISSLEDGDKIRECIEQPGLEVATTAADVFSSDNSMQYTAVHRQDAPGAVVIGSRGLREQSLRVVSSFANLTENFDLGRNGFIIAFKDGALLGDEIPPFPTADLISLPLNKSQRLWLGDSEYYGYAIRQEGYRLVGLMPTRELRRSSMRILHPVLASNAVLFTLIFVVVFYLLQRLVIRNIARINAALRKISQGNVGVRVDTAGFPPELRKLSQSINAVVDAMQSFGDKNDEAAAREQEQARAVQNAIIPHAVPAFPLRPEFDICALSRRPKGVGGGVYDYFLQGEDTLCFVVAETTGSGMPAALFAMHALALIRRYAQADAEPGEVFAQVNADLSDAGFGGLYISAFFGQLTISTGELHCAAAGLAHALLQRGGGAYTPLAVPPAPALGRASGIAFSSATYRLESADRLFVFTEGLLEATDAERMPYGEARLLEVLNGAAPAVADVPRRVNQAHRRFTRGAETGADVAFLALEFVGHRHERNSLTLCTDELGKADSFLEECLERVFAAPVAISDMQQAVRSVGQALPPGVQLELVLDYDEEQACAELRFPAPAFNPLPALPRPLRVDRSAYAAGADGANIVTIWKSLS